MPLLILLASLLLTSSIYNIQFKNIDGVSQSISQYQGKKILLVNIATGSARASQLAGLQQLQQEYADSLVVIGFPSNSFSHEVRSNVEIKQFCLSQYGVTFLLAEKNPVSGLGIQSIYHWLTKKSENDAMDGAVGADFQKYLINQTGELIGVFSPAVLPMSQEIIGAIKN